MCAQEADFFSTTHKVQAKENLTVIGRIYGYDNPGPIVAFPVNSGKKFTKPPYMIYPGDQIPVPYCRDLLNKIIATSEYLIKQTVEDTKKFMKIAEIHKNDINSFLFKIDAINFVAQIGVSIGSFAAKGVNQTYKEVLVWLGEHTASKLSGMTTFVVPAPNAPKKDFKFYIRHTLGPWNPSYWASVAGAIVNKDMDVWLYGADAVTYKEKMRLKYQADKDIAKLKKRIAKAKSQLILPFNKKRI